jgi:hypothetical protein
MLRKKIPLKKCQVIIRAQALKRWATFRCSAFLSFVIMKFEQEEIYRRGNFPTVFHLETKFLVVLKRKFSFLTFCENLSFRSHFIFAVCEESIQNVSKTFVNFLRKNVQKVKQTLKQREILAKIRKLKLFFQR